MTADVEPVHTVEIFSLMLCQGEGGRRWKTDILIRRPIEGTILASFESPWLPLMDAMADADALLWAYASGGVVGFEAFIASQGGGLLPQAP